MTPALPHNPYGLASLWSQGDFAIRAVAALLLMMSLASWLVIVLRGWRLWKLRRAARAAAGFWQANTFAEGLERLDGDAARDPFRHLAEEAQAAMAHHGGGSALHEKIGLNDWMTESLRGALDDSTGRLQSGLPLLASVGSTAPFVGLFGTVWGIYHALVGIGVSGQAGIDKVAGPVGEALIMTAFGLAVAIPAVLAYNVLTRANKRLLGRLNRFARQLHAYFLTGAPVARGRAKER